MNKYRFRGTELQHCSTCVITSSWSGDQTRGYSLSTVYNNREKVNLYIFSAYSIVSHLVQTHDITTQKNGRYAGSHPVPVFLSGKPSHDLTLPARHPLLLPIHLMRTGSLIAVMVFRHRFSYSRKPAYSLKNRICRPAHQAPRLKGESYEG